MTPCKTLGTLAAALAVAALAGCAPAPVKDIAANKSAYLDANFSPAQLSPNIKQQLASPDPVTPQARSLRLRMKAVFEDLGKPAHTPTALLTLTSAGDSLVQEMVEYLNNDIAYGIHYSLTYMGMIPLRQQSVRLNQRASGLTFEAKQIKEVSKEARRPRENTDYVFAWTNGNTQQLMNFSDIRLACRSETPYAASTLHPKLSGSAINLNCSREINGVTRAKQTFAVLPAYGVAIKTQFQSSNSKETFTIEDVELM